MVGLLGGFSSNIFGFLGSKQEEDKDSFSVQERTKFISDTNSLRPITLDIYKNGVFDPETDADSMDVLYKGRRFGIRYAGIDAPEVPHNNATEGKKPGQKYGAESVRIFRDIIEKDSLTKNNVYIQTRGETDAYGRVISEVFYKNKSGEIVSLNQELVRRKAAYLYEDPKYADRKVATPEILATYQQYLEEALNTGGTGIYSKDAEVPGDFRKLIRGSLSQEEVQTIHERAKVNVYSKKYGISNKQLASYLFEDDKLNIVAPSRMGHRYFYEQMLYNATRRVSGHKTNDYTNTEGIVTAMYTQQYIAKNGVAPEKVDEFYLNYDRYLQTPGLGAVVNEYFMAAGWGRLYKDEKGFIGSALGGIGQILDNTVTYYGPNGTNYDWLASIYPLDVNSQFTEPKEGFFESTFTFAGNFANITVASVASYFAFGLPISQISAMSFQTGLQASLNQATGFGLDTKNQSMLSQILLDKAGVTSLGMGVSNLNPEEVQELISDWISTGEAYNDPRNANRLKDFVGNVIVDQTNKVKVVALKADGTTELINYYDSAENISLPTLNNVFYRLRSAHLFENIIDPFIKDVVNPYAASSIEFKKLDKALTSFRETLGQTIELSVERASSTASKHRLTAENVGFIRARKVAKAFDKLAMLIPANPFTWGWGTKTLQTGTRIKTMGSIFSFTEIVDTFHNVFFGHHFDNLYNKSEIVNLTDLSFGTQLSNKISTITNLGVNLVKRNTSRFLKEIRQNPFSLFNRNSAAQLYDSFRKSKNYLAEAQHLEVDEYGKLKFNLEVDTPSGSSANLKQLLQPEELDDFLTKLLAVNTKVEATADAFNIRQGLDDRALHQANYAKELQVKGNFTAKSTKFNIKSSFNLILSTFLFSAIADSVLKSEGQVPLLDQIMLNFSIPTQFTSGPLFSLFGPGLVGVTASKLTYGALAIASSALIAYSVQDINLRKFKIDEGTKQLFTQVVDLNKAKYAKALGLNSSAKTGQVVEILTDLMENKGVKIPKGRYATAFNISLAAFIFAPGIIGAGISAIGNIVNHYLGRTGQVASIDFSLVSKLTELRSSVIHDMNNGVKVDNSLMVGAYMAGYLSQGISILKESSRTKGRVESTAKQAPTAIFQFFTAESTKYSTNPSDKGVKTISAGFQAAPILGINLGMSLPFQINNNTNNPLQKLVASDADNNVTNYLTALASLGGNVYTTSLITYSLLSSFSFLLDKGPFKNFTKEAVANLNNASNLIQTANRFVDIGIDVTLSLPNSALNAIRTMYGSAELEQFKYFRRATLSTTGPNVIKAGGGLFKGIIAGAIYSFIASSLKDFIPTPWDDTPELKQGIFATSGFITGLFVGLHKPAVITPTSGKIHRATTRLLNTVSNVATIPLRTIAYGDRFVTNNLQKFARFEDSLTRPLAKKGFKFARRMKLPLAFFAISSFYNTQTGFGYAEGIDANKISQVATIGAYTAIQATAFTYFSNWGATANETIDSYLKVQQVRQTRPGKIFSFLLDRKKDQLAKDIQVYNKLLHEWKLSGAPSINAVEHLTELTDNLPNKLFREYGSREDVLKHVNEDELREFSKFYKKSGREFTEWFHSKRRGPAKGRFGQGLLALALVSTVATAGMELFGRIKGGWDLNSRGAANSFYQTVDTEGPLAFIGDTVRLLTNRDRTLTADAFGNSILNTVTLDYASRQLNKRGAKLIAPNQASSNLQKFIQQVAEPISKSIVIDPSDPFLTFFVVGGTTRVGEDGDRINTYVQFQSAGTDVSAAIYNIAPAFLTEMGNSAKLRIIYDQIYKQETGGKGSFRSLTKKQQKRIGRRTSRLSAYTDPLRDDQKRRTSQLSDESLSLIGKDSIISLSVGERIRDTTRVALQPLLSLANEMINPLNVSYRLNPDNLKDSSFKKNFSELLNGQAKVRLNYYLSNPLGQIKWQQGIQFASDRTKGGSISAATQTTSVTDVIESYSITADNLKNQNQQGFFAKLSQTFGLFGKIAQSMGIPLLPVAVSAAVISFIGLGSVFSGIATTVGTSIATKLSQAPNIVTNMYGASTDTPFKVTSPSITGKPTTSLLVENSSSVFNTFQGRNVYEIQLPKGFDSTKTATEIEQVLSNIVQKIGEEGPESINSKLLQSLNDLEFQKVSELLNSGRDLSSLSTQEIFKINQALSGNAPYHVPTPNMYNKVLSREEVIKSLKTQYLSAFDKYIDEVLNVLDEVPTGVVGKSLQGLSFLEFINAGGNLSAQDMINMRGIDGSSSVSSIKDLRKKELIEQLDIKITKVLEEEVSKIGFNLKGHFNPSDILTRYSVDIKQQYQILNNLVLSELTPLFESVQRGLIVMNQASNLQIEARNRAINEVADRVGGTITAVRRRLNKVPFTGPTRRLTGVDIIDNIPSVTKAKVKPMAIVGKGLKVLTEGLVIISSIIETVDILGSTAELADAQDKKYVSSGEIEVLEQRLGASIVNSIGMGLIGAGVMGTLAAFGATSIAPLLIAGLVVGGAVWGISNLSRANSKVGNFVKNTIKNTGNFLTNAYNAASSGIGEFVGDTLPTFMHKGTFGIVSKSNATTFLGGAIASGVLVAGLGIAGTLGAAVLGGVGVSLAGAALLTGAATIGVGLLAAGLIGGVAFLGLSMIPGVKSGIANWFAGASKDSLLFTSKESVTTDAMYYQPNSPFQLGLAGDVIKQEYTSLLKAGFEDYTGDATKYIFTNNIRAVELEGNEGRRFSGGNITPFSITDPIIEKELSIRGQYYNQTVIGKAIYLTKLGDSVDVNKAKQEYFGEQKREILEAKKYLKAQQEKDLEQVKQQKASILKGEKVTLAIANNIISTAINKQEASNPQQIKSTLIIDKQSTSNNFIKEAETEVTKQNGGKVPVFVKLKEVLKDKENKKAVIKESIDSSNDLISISIGSHIDAGQVYNTGFAF